MIIEVTSPHCTVLQVQTLVQTLMMFRLKTNKQTNEQISKTATYKSRRQSGKFFAKRLQLNNN